MSRVARLGIAGMDTVIAGDIHVRRHGTGGPVAIVLHGGPAAVGSACSLARGLACGFTVLEPWQRGSGEEPLTVARHVADLHEVVRSAHFSRPALVGESWGAMLALAYAAAHPHDAGPIVLVGCGTFDPQSRKRIGEILEARMDDVVRQRLRRLEHETTDARQRLIEKYRLLKHLYVFDPLPCDDEESPLDVQAHQETWDDMLRLQREGVYPAAFSGITSPVLMLHGAYDPHPGSLIRDGLLPYLPHLEYREWKRCGHHPWKERGIREEFFAVLRAWLHRHLPAQGL